MESLDTAELLAQLKGIHLPEAPVAPALYPVFLSVAVCMAALLAYLIRNYKKQSHWHIEAISALDNIQTVSPPAIAMQRTAALLKRIALTHTTDKSIFYLHGEPWLNYLDNFYRTNFFSEGNGRVFGSALYQPGTRLDDNLYTDLKRLIKRRGRIR